MYILINITFKCFITYCGCFVKNFACTCGVLDSLVAIFVIKRDFSFEDRLST